MLFSREDVAEYVNRNFESAWEMVRPVPIVSFDFGNGHVATRTLHGNIATHVCCADGQVVDILPGIYTPAVFMASLGTIRSQAVAVNGAADKQTRLQTYHRGRAQLVRSRPNDATSARAPAPVAPPAAIQDRGKGIIERRVEQIVQPNVAALQAALAYQRPRPGANIANWDALALDTWRNETERRLQIHERLTSAHATRPDQIKRWLYKEVLHADLDDPYLGLGDALFGDDILRGLER